MKYFEKNRNNTPLGLEQNNCTTKIVNAYIVYDLDHWPKNPFRNFTLNFILFGATNLVKSNDKEKHVNVGYGIVSHGNADGVLMMTLQ